VRYLSVCSGIEAASAAWDGWEPVAFAEVEPFPCAVLKHHYPHVPNWGDVTKFKEWPDAAVDVLVGGTPCQSFSVAGLRQGLADPRGNLALVYLAILDRYRPQWMVWENVPGVLSSGGGRDFGAFIGGLEQLGYHAAWRVLDAQYVRVDGYERAVPQRRRRVFVVGHSRDWRCSASVLFERESLQGHPAPRRKAGEGIAPTTGSRPTGGGGLGTDFDCDGGLIAGTLGQRSADHTSGLKSESEFIVPVVANPLTHRMHKGMNIAGDGGKTMVAHALKADGFDASEDGTGRGTPLVPQLYSIMPMNSGKNYKARAVEVAQPLMAAGPGMGDQGGDYVVAYGLRSDAARSGEAKTPSADAEGRVRLRDAGFNVSEGFAPTLDATGPHTVAFPLQYGNGQGGKSQGGVGVGEAGAPSYTLDSQGPVHGVAHGWAVRRLTPLECERLQGFPDGYTAVPYRGKPASDGPRYKALGNSMAVNCMRWIGRRIEKIEVMP